MSLRKKKKTPQEAICLLTDESEREKFRITYINPYIGYGVFAKENIPANELIMEYRGVFLTETPDMYSPFLYHVKHGTRFCCIDATDNKCVARMVNDIDYSTKPSCKMRKIIVDGVPRLGLFSIKEILRGTELRYDYGDSSPEWRKKKCRSHSEDNIEDQVIQVDPGNIEEPVVQVDQGDIEEPVVQVDIEVNLIQAENGDKEANVAPDDQDDNKDHVVQVDKGDTEKHMVQDDQGYIEDQVIQVDPGNIEEPVVQVDQGDIEEPVVQVDIEVNLIQAENGDKEANVAPDVQGDNKEHVVQVDKGDTEKHMVQDDQGYIEDQVIQVDPGNIEEPVVQVDQGDIEEPVVHVDIEVNLIQAENGDKEANVTPNDQDDNKDHVFQVDKGDTEKYLVQDDQGYIEDQVIQVDPGNIEEPVVQVDQGDIEEPVVQVDIEVNLIQAENGDKEANVAPDDQDDNKDHVVQVDKGDTEKHMVQDDQSHIEDQVIQVDPGNIEEPVVQFDQGDIEEPVVQVDIEVNLIQAENADKEANVAPDDQDDNKDHVVQVDKGDTEKHMVQDDQGYIEDQVIQVDPGNIEEPVVQFDQGDIEEQLVQENKCDTNEQLINRDKFGTGEQIVQVDQVCAGEQVKAYPDGEIILWCVRKDSGEIDLQSKKADKQHIQTVSKQKNGKHDYSKTHACVFCGKLDLKIARHLETKHGNEAVIAALPKASKDRKSESSVKRKQVLDTLRNRGDFLFNVDVLKNLKSGVDAEELIVARRPDAFLHEVKDYLPCKFCLRFFIKSDLYRHCAECNFASTPLHTAHTEARKHEKSFISAGQQLLAGAGVLQNQYGDLQSKKEFYSYIMDSMAMDEIGKEVKKDGGIIRYGKCQFDKLGKQRASGIRYRMRLLVRLKMRLLQLQVVGEGPDLDTYLRPENFDNIAEAVKKIVEVSDERSLNGVQMFEKPEVAKKYGQCLRKLAEMYQGRMIVERNQESRQNVADFLVMYESEWSDRIGSLAHQTANERRFNKKEILPRTEDVVKLQKFQDNMIKEKVDSLSKDRSKTVWMELGKCLLSKIQTFNFRRGNESSKMQLHKYVERADWRQGNTEIYQSLGKLERALAENMDLVEVIGKQNRKVPVLLTRPMKSGIDLLNSTREECGVDPSNAFVFAKGADSYITGAEALNYVLKHVPDLEQPEQIRLPKMRKYLATVTQVMGIDDVELMEVARHMGHELSVHRKFYRLQDDVIELAKVSKLLLAVEAGVLNKFSGKTLDDIDLEALPDVQEESTDNRDNSLGNPQDTGIGLRALPDVQEESTDNRDNSLGNPQDTGIGLRDRRGGRNNYSLDTLYSFDDKVADPDFRTGAAALLSDSDSELEVPRKKPKRAAALSSDSDSELEVPSKKPKLCAKKKWTTDEKAALRTLVDKATLEQKPPKKADIQKIQKLNFILQNLKWTSIKHNVWAMAQQKRKELPLIKYHIP